MLKDSSRGRCQAMQTRTHARIHLQFNWSHLRCRELLKGWIVTSENIIFVGHNALVVLCYHQQWSNIFIHPQTRFWTAMQCKCQPKPMHSTNSNSRLYGINCTDRNKCVQRLGNCLLAAGRWTHLSVVRLLKSQYHCSLLQGCHERVIWKFEWFYSVW